MILEYLYRLRDILQNGGSNKRKKHGSSKNLPKIIRANDVMLNVIRGHIFKVKHPIFMKISDDNNLRGGDVNAILGNIHEIDKGLKELIIKMKDDTKSQENVKKILENVKEIVEVATILVKNLGEQYELIKDTDSIKKIQSQITQIVESLKEYLGDDIRT